jgi:MFS superfamily sulfate permease-like transporter
LGGGSAGYHAALAVGLAAGIIQIVFGLARIGKVSDFFPTAAVHGMLAAIGIIIIAKQIYIVFGAAAPKGANNIMLLVGAPEGALHNVGPVALIGVVSLAIMFLWPRIPIGLVKKIPAHFIVLAFSIPMSLMFGLGAEHHYEGALGAADLGPSFLVKVPDHLSDLINRPNLSALANPVAWNYVVMFALVGTLESMLTAKAIDGIARTSSSLNRDNLAVGIGNTLSALLGGLPMISEVVRSKANLDNGCTSWKANFAHGVFLLLCIALIPGFVHLIPLAALAAMLVFTGCRLASWKEFQHMWKVGRDQFMVFMVTLIVTLLTDLLKGIFAGLVVEAIIQLIWGANPATMFKVTTVDSSEATKDHAVIIVTSQATFTNLIALRSRIAKVDRQKPLVIDFSRSPLVDHSVFLGLQEMSMTRPAPIEVRGLDGLTPVASHPDATRRRRGAAAANEASHG